MKNPLNKIKPAVRALRAYSLTPERGRVKINQNENPWDAPARIKDETRGRLDARQWSRYPDFVPATLQKRLAGFADWDADGIIAGNGSNELIQALLMVTVGRGNRVLIVEPTFALYRQITTVLGGEVVTVPLNENFSFDVPSLVAAAENLLPDVTIICSPNNPTGCVLSDDDLRSVLESTSGLVVVDEAYHEFAEHSVVPLLREYDNLIVLRTFSKAMALAAFRVGYLLTSPALAHEIKKAVLPYNLNAISQTAAEVAVEMYDSELRPLVQLIIGERERLFDELASIEGLSPVRSRANFMVVRSKMNPRQVFANLLERDILIRDVSSYPMLTEFFRVSVGTPAENDLLIGALKNIFDAGEA